MLFYARHDHHFSDSIYPNPRPSHSFHISIFHQDIHRTLRLHAWPELLCSFIPISRHSTFLKDVNELCWAAQYLTYFLLAPELVELGTTTVSAVVYDVLEPLPLLLLLVAVVLVVVVVLVVDGVVLYEVVVEEELGGER